MELIINAAAAEQKITAEMALREPQEDSLIKFANVIHPLSLSNTAQGRIKRMLETGSLQFPDDYARLTFALATGVGKTLLMGAIIAWLFNEKKSRHFVILAPSSTIYRKLKAETIRTHPKYLLRGLAGFPTPQVYCAENIDTFSPAMVAATDVPVLFIFTPGQIRPSAKDELERRMRRDGEVLGDSMVSQLAAMDDLIVFLDEAHRFGQDANAERSWAQAVIDLKPKLVIEMTATPSNPNTVFYRYDLHDALIEGKYVKRVAAIYEERQQAIQDEEWDKHSIQEGLGRLEVKKIASETYKQNEPGAPIVKPVMLVSCKDTTHAAWCEEWIQSKSCFNGKYKGKTLRVDITRSEAEINRLLEVEDPDSEIEIVINVGMLKEGWDVTNVYVILPLRAMLSETLATQTIGRGLRLPYGHRVGDYEADTLDVITFGKEKVQDVIEKAKAIGADTRASQQAKGIMKVLVTPSSELTLQIPNVYPTYEHAPSLKGFSPQPSVSFNADEEAKLKRVEGITGDVTEIEPVSPIQGVKSWPKRLGRMLCRSISELGGQEAEGERIFQEYFKAHGLEKPDEQAQAVSKFGELIYNDVKDQAKKHLNAIQNKYKSAKTKHRAFTFGAVTYAVPKAKPEMPYRDAKTTDDRVSLLIGWRKSLYEKIKVDTENEQKVAEILDKEQLKVWVRNPVSQFKVCTTMGTHSPDFMIIEDGEISLIEVKRASEWGDPSLKAYRKSKAAVEWCALATAAGTQKWNYIGIRDEDVSDCANLKDIRNHAVSFL